MATAMWTVPTAKPEPCSASTAREQRELDACFDILYGVPVLEHGSEIARRLNANEDDELGIEVVMLMQQAYRAGVKTGRAK